jgi:hypothetical protein
MNELDVNIEHLRYLLLRTITHNQPDKKLIDQIEDTLDVTLNIATDSEVMGQVLTIASMLLAINAWKRGKNLLGMRLLETGWVLIPSLLPPLR